MLYLSCIVLLFLPDIGIFKKVWHFWQHKLHPSCSFWCFGRRGFNHFLLELFLALPDWVTVKLSLSFQTTLIRGLIKGNEVGLEELEKRADQAQIQKVCLFSVSSIMWKWLRILMFVYWILPAIQNIGARVGDIFSVRCYNMQDCCSRCIVTKNVQNFASSL